MILRYFKTFFSIAVIYLIFTAIFFWAIITFISPFALSYLSKAQFYSLIVGIYFSIISYATYRSLVEDSEVQHKRELEEINHRHENEIAEKNETINQILSEKSLIAKNAQVFKTSLEERSSGFPTLMNAIKEYDKKQDDSLSDYLRWKKHPAKKASEIVKIEAKRRRDAEFFTKTTQAIIEYYENIAPFLIDLKNEFVDTEEDDIIFREYSEKERKDPVVNFLTKEEYRKLSTTEKNQLALDRFWKRRKSKKLIGRLYERYVGYIFERDGYNVEYVGIFKGYEDLGRDLICSKGNDFIIVQCKYWAQFKTIYEKHIFQFFGTVFQYRDSNPEKKVTAVFCTSTSLSDLARRFAKELKIKLTENFPFDKSYPCIKCNINPLTKEKIYHLPFDQQYDRTKIDRPGEFYCKTIIEAEDMGFRRALRWRGNK